VSDHSISIVDIEVSKRDAKAAAASIVTYLVDRQIVASRKTNCVLSLKAKGYPPGDKYAAACVKPFPSFLTLDSNGLEVCLGRDPFLAIENGLEVSCPKCRHKILEPDDAWMEATEEWYKGNDKASYACPKCRKPTLLPRWDGPFPWGYGKLGLTFWNWPELKPKFVKDVAGVLGHEVRVVHCHM
jgi:DNA-directed RNA polymerase subunit RPC12/RpoP